MMAKVEDVLREPRIEGGTLFNLIYLFFMVKKQQKLCEQPRSPGPL